MYAESTFNNYEHMSTISYTEKVIYCGIQNNVFLPIYHTSINHIQNQNKVTEFLVAWLFTMPYSWKIF